MGSKTGCSAVSLSSASSRASVTSSAGSSTSTVVCVDPTHVGAPPLARLAAANLVEMLANLVEVLEPRNPLCANNRSGAVMDMNLETLVERARSKFAGETPPALAANWRRPGGRHSLGNPRGRAKCWKLFGYEAGQRG